VTKAVKKEKVAKTETRAQAERAIAATSDMDLLGSARFSKHANKHVRAKATAKLGRLT